VKFYQEVAGICVNNMAALCTYIILFYFVRYDVLIAMMINNTFFSDVPPSELMCTYRRCGGTCCFCLHTSGSQKCCHMSVALHSIPEDCNVEHVFF
jgi:hypothetical protein